MRIFTDQNCGTSLGRALRLVGADIELYHDRYASGMVPDDRWVSEVTAEGLVILTKDTRIRSRPNERAVFEAVGAKAFVIATRGATRLENLRAVLIAWHAMEYEVEDRPGPFMFGINRAGRMTRYIPPVKRTPHRSAGRAEG